MWPNVRNIPGICLNEGIEEKYEKLKSESISI
jgi:hypothetical protein